MKKGKILVVDDNKGIRDALKILLGGYFAQVQTLPSGQGENPVFRITKKYVPLNR